MTTTASWRRGLAGALLASSVVACAAHGDIQEPEYVRGALVQVDVYDRAGGGVLPVYGRGGRRYIVGTPGHEYAVRIRNATGARVLVVTSVDGVNVISGETAAPSQSGYVLEPGRSVEILGWRKSTERTAAFYFTDHRNSYAARTGRPNDVGVIGVAVFRERPKPLPRRDYDLHSEGQGGAQPSMGTRGLDSEDAPRPPAAAPAERSAASEVARPAQRDLGPYPGPSLGTGHGRSELSRVQIVTFERASDTPSETVTLRYDRRENLVAMGVIPAEPPRFTRREAEPFPGMRFAPDPPR